MVQVQGKSVKIEFINSKPLERVKIVYIFLKKLKSIKSLNKEKKDRKSRANVKFF